MLQSVQINPPFIISQRPRAKMPVHNESGAYITASIAGPRRDAFRPRKPQSSLRVFFCGCFFLLSSVTP